MNYTEGEWKVDSQSKCVFTGNDEHHITTYIAFVSDNRGLLKKGEPQANAHLIAAAVNACQSVNPDNPLAVAENIKDIYEALKKVSQIEQTTGKVCAVCGGYLDHKRDCVIPLAEKALAKAEGKGQ